LDCHDQIRVFQAVTPQLQFSLVCQRTECPAAGPDSKRAAPAAKLAVAPQLQEHFG
jgi:hypothetical protein